jgi:putative tributyrin esterase
MALAEIKFGPENSLHRMVSATVILPEKAVGPFPVLYLLHGMTDDHTAWTRKSRVESYVADLPLIVVMPDTERGWYSDALCDPSKQFESFITLDLIPFVDSTFQTVAARPGRAVAGLSMGGHGAVRLAFRHPELFTMAHGFSSGFDFGRGHRADNSEMNLIYGDEPIGSDWDLHAVAEKVDVKTLPKISFDTGVEDFVLQSNRDLTAVLKKLNIPHQYTEFPGSHNWDYWDEHIKLELPTIARELGIAPKAKPIA